MVIDYWSLEGPLHLSQRLTHSRHCTDAHLALQQNQDWEQEVSRADKDSWNSQPNSSSPIFSFPHGDCSLINVKFSTVGTRSLLWFFILPSVISPSSGALSVIDKLKTCVLYFQSKLTLLSNCPLEICRWVSQKCIQLNMFETRCCPDSLASNLFPPQFYKRHHHLFSCTSEDYWLLYLFYRFIVINQVLLILPPKHALSSPTSLWICSLTLTQVTIFSLLA